MSLKNNKVRRGIDRFMNKKCYDHKGNEYPSVNAMCKAYGISVSTYYGRRKKEWSLQEALETEAEKHVRDTVFDHKGVEYPSVKAMCRAYGISATTYYDRIKLGWSLQETLETEVEKRVRGTVFDHKGVGYPSLSTMCKAYGISVAAYYNRIKLGWSLQETLETEVEKYVRGTVFDHKGVEYPSVRAMCKAYGVDNVTYISRLRSGCSMQEALEKKYEKMVVVDHKGVEYPSVNAMCRAYGIPSSVYRGRIKLGYSIQEALEEREKVFDHKGVEYPSVSAMCKAYGIDKGTYKYRKRNGYSLEDALTMLVKRTSYNGFNILSYEKINGIVFYKVTREDTGEEYFLTREMMDVEK